jgi:acyl carrier protein
MDNIREQIHEYVSSLAQEQGHTDNVADDESLIVSGLLDSFSVMRLVVFLEKTFGISFAEEYFDQDIFDTIERMVDFVKDRVEDQG